MKPWKGPKASPAPCQKTLEICPGETQVTRKAMNTPMIMAWEMASCLKAGT